jgi:hypothetical protein
MKSKLDNATIIFCCDGTKTYNGITLQTQSFTVKEVVFIVNELIHKLNLKCSIHMQRGQPTIYISSKSMEKNTSLYFTLYLSFYEI